jgi:hypothetical protein
MYSDSINRGMSFLRKQSENGMFPCYISHEEQMDGIKISPPDVASSILVLSVIDRLPSSQLAKEVRAYVGKSDRDGLFSYFEYPYSADIDDSAVGIMVMGRGEPKDEYATAVRKVIENTDSQGVIHVWLEPGHDQNVDAVACVNALRLAYLYKLQKEVGPTVSYVVKHLESGQWLSGTRYYHLPEMFLYFLAKLQAETGTLTKQRERMHKAVRDRLKDKSGPASLAMAITAGCLLGIEVETPSRELANLQQLDGSWAIQSLWHFGHQLGYFGSPSLSTVFAIEALFLSGLRY